MNINRFKILVVVALLGLLVSFLLQREIQNFFYSVVDSRNLAFVLARSTRFLINDFFVILLIYAIFKQKKYVIFAIYVQLAGIVVVLIPYLVLKTMGNYNGVLISYLHRLVVNPLLLLILIPAFFYQKTLESN